MRRSNEIVRFGSAERRARSALLRMLCALFLFGLPAAAAGVEESAETVVGAGSDLADPLAWLGDYRQALGSDALAGATVGAGVFAVLMSLYSVLVLLRGQRRQIQLLEARRREGAPARPSQPPTSDQASGSRFPEVDLVIEPLEAKRPGPAAPPATRPNSPAPAAAPSRPSGPFPSPSPDPGVPAPSPERRAEVHSAGVSSESPFLPDPDIDLPALRSAEPLDAEGRVCQCFALLAEGRLDEAIEVTRQGLDGHPDAGRVFSQLSRVASLLGRKDQAIELATRAYRSERSEERFEQLLRLRCAAHRFEPREGDRLRRAVAYHPEQPVYLRALGIFEALHGNMETARRLLRAALRHENGEETRGAIARELLQLDRANAGRRFAARANAPGPSQ